MIYSMYQNALKYLVGCIGSRGVVIYISKTTTPDDLYYTLVFPLIFVISFS
jgi:hypothetical protein